MEPSMPIKNHYFSFLRHKESSLASRTRRMQEKVIPVQIQINTGKPDANTNKCNTKTRSKGWDS